MPNVPDHSDVVQEVHQRGGFDLATREGCGRFTEVVASVLYVRDRRFGLLKKNSRQNQWNGHAVDAVLYLSDTPGQSVAVDIIAASETPGAGPWWGEDIPRYSREHWIEPESVGPGVPPTPPAPADPVALGLQRIAEIHEMSHEMLAHLRHFRQLFP